MYCVHGRNGPGARKATTEPARMKAGNAATASAAERSAALDSVAPAGVVSEGGTRFGVAIEASCPLDGIAVPFRGIAHTLRHEI